MGIALLFDRSEQAIVDTHNVETELAKKELTRVDILMHAPHGGSDQTNISNGIEQRGIL